MFALENNETRRWQIRINLVLRSAASKKWLQYLLVFTVYSQLRIRKQTAPLSDTLQTNLECRPSLRLAGATSSTANYDRKTSFAPFAALALIALLTLQAMPLALEYCSTSQIYTLYFVTIGEIDFCCICPLSLIN